MGKSCKMGPFYRGLQVHVKTSTFQLSLSNRAKCLQFVICQTRGHVHDPLNSLLLTWICQITQNNPRTTHDLKISKWQKILIPLVELENAQDLFLGFLEILIPYSSVSGFDIMKLNDSSAHVFERFLLLRF